MNCDIVTGTGSNYESIRGDIPREFNAADFVRFDRRINAQTFESCERAKHVSVKVQVTRMKKKRLENLKIHSQASRDVHSA